MRVLVFISVALLLMHSCTTGYALKSVDYKELFTDGNSKVWLINKLIVKGVNISQYELESKEVFIFHSNGAVDYLPLKAMGRKKPLKANYYLDSENKTLTLYFTGETWSFDLTTLKEDKIIMKSNKDSDTKIVLELIPLPEL